MKRIKNKKLAIDLNNQSFKLVAKKNIGIAVPNYIKIFRKNNIGIFRYLFLM
jgi:hypothetical protein